MSMHHLGPYHDSEHYAGVPARTYARVHFAREYLPEEVAVRFTPDFCVDATQAELE